MSYTRNFGFRSFENIVRMARFRTPAGTNYEIGSSVAVDPNNVGFMKLATAAQAPSPSCGLVLFEHIQSPGVDPLLTTNLDLHTVPGGRYAQIVHGVGTKVWFRNTQDKTLYDGRTQAGNALLASSVDVSSLKAGDKLVPNGDGKLKVGASGDTAWLVIEQVNPTSGLVEARFQF